MRTGEIGVKKKMKWGNRCEDDYGCEILLLDE